MASLALHALLFIPLMFGGERKGSESSQYLAALSGAGRGDDTEMTLEPLDDDSLVSDPDTNLAAESRALNPTPVSVPLRATPPPAFSIDDGDGEEPSTGSRNPEMLFGRYIGQITARIERAWMRPRTAIGSPLFACQVQIIQNHGAVVEVTLQRCNGDSRWQMSLVRAIQTASPLPAPPDPALYESRLILDFSATSFMPGDNAEGFEPPALNVASSATP